MCLNEEQKLELMKQNVSYLTKRELFAAMMMQAWVGFNPENSFKDGAIAAVQAADALIAELSKGDK